MRFQRKPYSREYPTTRVTRVFLLLPLWTDSEWRWLECANIEEVWIGNKWVFVGFRS